jgi:hypothetical protein
MRFNRYRTYIFRDIQKVQVPDPARLKIAMVQSVGAFWGGVAVSVFQTSLNALAHRPFSHS